MSEFLATNTKGEMVKGVAKTVDARGAVIDLGNGIEGYITAADLSRDRVEDATKVLKEGDELDSRFNSVDRKERPVLITVREKENQEETGRASWRERVCHTVYIPVGA